MVEKKKNIAEEGDKERMGKNKNGSTTMMLNKAA